MKTASLAARMAALCVCGVLCASCGPRMRVMPSIQPYERRMPDMPEGTVPKGGRLQTMTAEQSKLAANPAPPTHANIETGGIYYGYYCVMCHGRKGDGNGPVGEGYVPKPADLSSPRVAALSDGELYNRMLHGPGHAPVMDQTVLPQHRWPLVLYVRTFAEPSEGHPRPR